MAENHKYWFPAKRYGWGWGVPTCWQGWTVYATYFLLLSFGISVLVPAGEIVAFIGLIVLSTSALAFICWKKGEPPAWHWGKK